MESKKNNRSTSYPSMSLPDSLDKLQKLKDSLGVHGEYDRESTARAMGYSSLSGSSARAVAALVHYGLLNRNKDRYSISELGKKYLLPTSDSSTREAVSEAALKPTLLKAIYDDYKDQPLPGQLKNILTITYGIQGPAADVALKVINQTYSFAGLLGADGTVGGMAQPATVEQAAENAVHQNPQNQVDQMAATSQLLTVSSSESEYTTNTSMTEQGINLSGDRWQLTVLLKTSKRHSAETRKKVRELLEMADSVADLLYGEDENERHE